MGLGRLRGAGPPSPRRGWDEEATAAPPGRGEGAARVSQVWARLPFAAFGYLSFPPLFSSFPLPLFSYAVGAARQPGSAQPPSVLPPSLSLIPPFSLKTWAPGCSPLRWQRPCPREQPLLLLHLRIPRLCPVSAPSPGPGVLDVAPGSGVWSGAALEGTCRRYGAGWGLLPTSGFSCCFIVIRTAGVVPEPRWLSGYTGGRGRSGGAQNRVWGTHRAAGMGEAGGNIQPLGEGMMCAARTSPAPAVWRYA